MKRIMYASCALLIAQILSAHKHKHETNSIDQPLVQLESLHKPKEEVIAELEVDHLNQSEHEEKNASTNLKQALFGSFQRFIRIFLILLHHQKIQNSVKTIESMVTSLVQTAFQAIKTATGNSQETHHDIAKKLLESDPALKRALADAVTKCASNYNPMPICKAHGPWCCQKPKQADKNAKIVLENFAQIATHFLNILQNPNDTQEVSPHLLGMLGSIINIGTQVIKSGNFDVNTSQEEITAFVENLDPSFKEELMHTITKTVQRAYTVQ